MCNSKISFKTFCNWYAYGRGPVDVVAYAYAQGKSDVNGKPISEYDSNNDIKDTFTTFESITEQLCDKNEFAGLKKMKDCSKNVFNQKMLYFSCLINIIVSKYTKQNLSDEYIVRNAFEFVLKYFHHKKFSFENGEKALSRLVNIAHDDLKLWRKYFDGSEVVEIPVINENKEWTNGVLVEAVEFYKICHPENFS